MTCAVVILAGGEGRRIGGGKPQRRLGGKPLIEHVIARAREQAPDIAIAVRSVDQPSFGLPSLLDLVGRGRSPAWSPPAPRRPGEDMMRC